MLGENSVDLNFFSYHTTRGSVAVLRGKNGSSGSGMVKFLKGRG